ncbi:MAG: DUF177 domain-containing protein [Elusimicrobia bacterium]|nr:DUF177 domain-containing protein [Elusimicrobiota bacterium]
MPLIYRTEEIVSEGGLSFSGPIEETKSFAEDIASPTARLNERLEAEFEISIGSKELLLLGQIEGGFKLVCSRCGDEFEQSFTQELEETYPLSAPEIDVGEQIRQALVLVLPVKPLCRGDCRGLCPTCGVNRNKEACSCRPAISNPFGKLKDIYKRKEQ